MKRYVFLFLFVSFSYSITAQEADHIVGIWQNPEKDLLIKIDKIGSNFQGRIVWLKQTQENDAALDVNNPNEHMSNMPLKGSKIIEDLIFDPATNCWEGGTYYSYKEGKLYNCQISHLAGGELRILKYLELEQDGVAETWTRHK